MPQVISKSIYHGLPVHPDKRGLTAIVTGASGISGNYMLRVLCESPERWKKIYALSRRPPSGEWPDRVHHVPMDLLQKPADISEQMKKYGINADYVYFFAYIQPKPKSGSGLWSDAEELVRINKELLVNFLEGLAFANIQPSRILLQQGAKYYGTHLGPAAIPSEESDPRVLLEPNFYYDQEDYLKEYCKKHKIGRNITKPCHILGAVPDAAMNLCFPLAVYATVQKHLGKALVFPTDIAAWDTAVTLSSSQMNAYLSEWAVLTPEAENEDFNAGDNCEFTWGKFWPKLAAYYRMPWEGPDTSTDSNPFKEISTPYNPPPRGFGPPGKMRYKFSFVEWASREEVQKAWREIARTHRLPDTELEDVERVFGFLDAALLAPQTGYLSTAKARKFGFFGFVDSNESILRVIEESAGLKMIPPQSAM